MNYTIFSHSQITPEQVIRPGAQGGEVLVTNPERPLLPAGATVIYTPAGYSRFAAEQSNRTLLLEDPNGTATLQQIKAALPLFVPSRQQLVKSEANRRIESKWPLWRQINCAIGIYTSATVALCAADIAAVITASNTAEDAISNATDLDSLLAVTPVWPTI